ncbi:MAG: sensor histidine kinase [Bacteroidota bacterium]
MGAQDLAKDPIIQTDFKRAEAYLKGFRNDSASVLLLGIMEQLQQKKQIDTPFGLMVQLRYAEALEKDHQDEEAIQRLLTLAEQSQTLNNWVVYAHANLSLARLYEKLDRQERCLSSLLSAKKAIQSHQIDSIYPRCAVRLSSYHRLFGDRDSALYYAQEVIRTAPLFGLTDELANGYLLVGMTLGEGDDQRRIPYFKNAGQLWLATGDYNGYGAIMSNLSKLYHRQKKPRLALVYNDSALIAAVKAQEMGVDEQWIFYANYKRRAEIYRDLGQHDSVWHYLNLGHRMELEDMYQTNYAKVAEIDARYNDQRKARKIAEQALQIRYEKQRRSLLFGIILFILLLTFLLAYYNIRLRKSNQKVEDQAQAISQANQDLSVALQQQLVLQGEVHHRVKNNLQVIISLLELQMEETDEQVVRNSYLGMSNRIYSMAAIHEILYQQKDASQLRFHDYVENLCMHFSHFSSPEDKLDYTLSLGDQHFNLATSMPLGIIITELLTNSIKYARQKDRQLAVSIQLESNGEGFCLQYQDNGPGFPQQRLEEREGGLGTYLLRSMVRQLRGRLVTKNDQGAVCEVYFKEKNS